MTNPIDDGMWLTSRVRVPRAIVDAQVAGSLVFFVGAGASAPRPSELPMFGPLASEVGTAARYRDRKPDESVDGYLGAVLAAGFDVHKFVSSRIGRPGVLPNENHHALARLSFGATPPNRVVTTNFDTLLSDAHKLASGTSPRTFAGPAVPLGRDFDGVVHLHGCVSEGRPSELVVTDADFGRAYLTDAWAPAFLREVFLHHVVLFVGFSHNDPVLDYFAMGMPRDAPRFILTADADNPRWTRLGIRPIGYPNEDKSHGAVTELLTEWARRTELSNLDHKTRVEVLARSGPPLSPSESDYLADRLVTDSGARAFASVATSSSAWLEWLDEVGLLGKLFDATASDAGLPGLAGWFVDHFVLDPEGRAPGFATASRHHCRLSSALSDAVSSALAKLSASDATTSLRWYEIVSRPAGFTPEWRAHYLYGRSSPTNALAVLERVLEPSFDLRISFGHPEARLSWPIRHGVDALIAKALESEDQRFKVAGLLRDTIERAASRSRPWSRGQWDSLASSRIAIEPHEQNYDRDRTLGHVLDSLAKIVEEGIPPSWTSEWWDSPALLVRRMAIYSIAFSADDPASRLEWLLGRQLLFDSSSKHETFAALAALGPLLDATQRERLLEEALKGPHHPDWPERSSAYEIYNLLVWMCRTIDWPEAQAELDALAKRHDFEAREHPDLERYVTTSVGLQLPESVEQFLERCTNEGFEAAFDWIIDRVEEKNPDFDNALSLIRLAVAESPEIALPMREASRSRPDMEILAALAIIRGIETRETTYSFTGELKQIIDEFLPLPAATDLIARILRRELTSLSTETEGITERIDDLASLAEQLWELHRESYVPHEGVTPTDLALNTWPGELVSFWVQVVSLRWQILGDDWHGLEQRERRALSSLAKGPTPTKPTVDAGLARHLYFLFNADEEFAASRVIPLFTSADAALNAWEPFLYHPRVDDRILSRGFGEAILEFAVKAPLLAESHGLDSQFWSLCSAVLIDTAASNEFRDELIGKLVLESAQIGLPGLLDAIRSRLSEDWTAADEVWRDWLGRVAKNRFDGLPREMKRPEVQAWADLVTVLGDEADGAVTLVASAPAPFRDFLPEVADEAMAPHADAHARLFVHRLKSGPIAGAAAWSVGEVAQQLLQLLDAAAARDFRRDCASHGVPGF